MKTEFTDISETQKALSIEIPTEVVDAEINRVARSYIKQARLPGFRPGKVPQGLIKKRFRDQIFHDVLHDLVPRAAFAWLRSAQRSRSLAGSPATSRATPLTFAYIT